MDKISVLIPTYNVELYIKEAVESILNQTYNNLEIIIVDDASTDNTYQILEQLSKTDDRIRLFRNNVNFGLCICKFYICLQHCPHAINMNKANVTALTFNNYYI